MNLIYCFGDEETKGKEESLELAPEEEKCAESTKSNENRQQGEPPHDPAKDVPGLVSNVCQGHRRESRCTAQQPCRDCENLRPIHN